MPDKSYKADVNCDLGEGNGQDDQIMPFLGSCNIACGGHAGNVHSMRHTLELTAQYNVRAGAHPSYPDREHFGRVQMDIEEEELWKSMVHQIHTLLEIADAAQVKIHHIKPHGALYNKAASHQATAQLMVRLVQAFKRDLILYAPYGSLLEQMGKAAGLEVWSEAFLDRNYRADLSLVPRAEPGAIISDTEIIRSRFREMFLHNRVKSQEGQFLEIRAGTYCLHGDNPEAPAIAREVQEEIKKLNV